MTPTDIADLVARATYRVGNPSAWTDYDEGASEIIRLLLAALEAIGRELLDEEQHNRALTKKLSSLSAHETCACSWDKPGDVCMHHSPALSTANAEVERLTRERDEALAKAASWQDVACMSGDDYNNIKAALEQYERLILINDVRQAAQLAAPLWLEEADRLSLAIQGDKP